MDVTEGIRAEARKGFDARIAAACQALEYALSGENPAANLTPEQRERVRLIGVTAAAGGTTA